MSRKPSFANLRTSVPVSAESRDAKGPSDGTARPASREGRKQIAGFFTPEMSLAMHMLSRRQNRSLQALMTEAFDDVLRKYGETPIGA